MKRARHQGGCQDRKGIRVGVGVGVGIGRGRDRDRDRVRGRDRGWGRPWCVLFLLVI